MENKLTWVELKKEVARQTELTEKEVNLILNAWLMEMTAALTRGDELRISGLGTFKLKDMKARKSVNVTTGEAIILPETQRLTYTMAAGLEEQLRDDAPASEPKRAKASAKKASKGNDPIQKLSDQANEILDILDKIGQTPKQAESVKEVKPKANKKKVEEKPERVAIPDYVIPEKPKKNRNWLTAIITIVIVLALAVGSYFYFEVKIAQWLDELSAKMENTIKQNKAKDNSKAKKAYAYPTQRPSTSSRTRIPDNDMEFNEYKERLERALDQAEMGQNSFDQARLNELIKAYEEQLRALEQPESVVVEQPEPVKEPEPVVVEQPGTTFRRVYTEFIATENMREGSRLTWMAYRYYGNKDLWVILYDANKNRIKNPDNIAAGTPIRIPKLSKELMDQSTPEARAFVKQLTREFSK